MDNPNDSTTSGPIVHQPDRQLSVFNCACIIVGIVIGSGIYGLTPRVALFVPTASAMIGVWILGGILALVGAVCYAELATKYPQSGGDYVFLTKGYGRRLGILFAWCEFWVIRPGSIGAMAFLFADYALKLVPMEMKNANLVYAAGAILLLTGVNLLGLKSGKWSQNVLTTIKVLGLLLIFVTTMLFISPFDATAAGLTEANGFEKPPTNYTLAMVFVLFSYGGWNDVTFVSAEVNNPKKNIFLSLLLGTSLIVVVYVLATIAFLRGLGLDGVAKSEAVAADLMKIPFGGTGEKAISLLVCITALGAINGMIFTGGRIFYALGAEHSLFAWLGKWDVNLRAPLRAFFVQSAVVLLIVVGFGAYHNDDGSSGFGRMVIFTTPIFWSFLFLVGLSMFWLRIPDDDVRPAYRMVLSLLSITFCLMCVFLIHSSLLYAYSEGHPEGWFSIITLISGILICLGIKGVSPNPT